MRLDRFTTADAPPGLLAVSRALLDRAFGDGQDGAFSNADWDHALGGWHVVAWDGEDLVAHGSVVPRRILVGEAWFEAGYVEAMATVPERRGEGFGLAVLMEVSELVRAHHQLGVLSTGDPGFYERAGWERWVGPTFVLDGGEPRRTPDEDDGIMVLLFGRSADVTLTDTIACEARPGDDW